MKIVELVDPYTNEALELTEKKLFNKNSEYPIIDGIPKFVKENTNEPQYDIEKCFSYQWTKSEFGQPEKFSDDAIRQDVLETMDLTEEDLALFNDKLVLDVGVGSGASSRLWSSRAKEFHGVDIGDGIYRAKNTLKDSTKNPVLSHADLHHLPYKDESFDVIVSNGVFHHTPNTKTSLKNSLKKLKVGGFCVFYIYKKKSPIREFSDDHIRSKISNLPYDEAYEKIKTITNFGKSLSEKNSDIIIPSDIEFLGIKKGTYNLQRFFYDNFFKCFWNKDWGYDYSNLVNIDWYHPKYCWRHTKEEILLWCNDMDLSVKYIKELESGYACFIEKTSKIT